MVNLKGTFNSSDNELHMFYRRTILFVAFLMATLAISTSNVQTVNAVPESNMLNVPWHWQRESGDPNQNLFCAVASVQMTIQYITGKVVPQPTLAKEMKTGPDCEGTCYWNIHLAFDSRNFTAVKAVRNSTLDDLKSLNAQGYVSIIGIWSDSSHKAGHYVVVVGYDADNIYVNNPAYTTAADGAGRKMPNSVLADLWTKHNQLVIRIPYPVQRSGFMIPMASSWAQAQLMAVRLIEPVLITSIVAAAILLMSQTTWRHAPSTASLNQRNRY